MEQEILSVISSSGEENANSDVSYSMISTAHHSNKRQRDVLDSIGGTAHHQANKRQRCSGKPNSSQFKGVMRQKKGQWGAQIYANHMRIWLGTFKTEKDAAMAYDTAAIKYRNGDTHRNFPWNEITIEEPKFLSLYSGEAVVSMIRDGSYQYKFMDFIKARSRRAQLDIDLNLVGNHSNEGLICKQMFQKKLTPSDVGKLNRLVIPKKFAVEYFPSVYGIEKNNVVKTNDVHLEFRDKFMRRWEFRYCYWNSSQSFVFTRGWNRFLKENKLKADDTISFYKCEWRKGNEAGKFCLIDVNKSENGVGEAFVVEANDNNVDLRLRLGQCDAVKQEQALKVERDDVVKTEGFKLFGMQINLS